MGVPLVGLLVLPPDEGLDEPELDEPVGPVEDPGVVEDMPVADTVGAVGVTDVHDELDELATLIGAEYCRLPTESRIWKVM